METKDIILELRTKMGLSQDDLAEKVMVTRQAVSRWENGDTVPNTDTLKLLSKEFDVSINTLLGEPRKLICQCCGMPLEDDAIMGRDSDGALNEDYCKWCYADGTYTYSNMDDLIDVCVKNMVNENFTEEQVRTYMKELLPKLDYWKRYEFHPEKHFGTLDWGRGVWTYDNTWYWGSGNCDVNGHAFGFNIGYGFGNTKAASENVIFYDGIAHKIDDVEFVIPEDDYCKPWKFTSSDGRFEMDFLPILDRSACLDYKLIVSDQHQVFGHMSGTAVLDDGTKVEIKDVLCFAEKVHNRY